MKNLIFYISLIVILLASCNGNKSTKSQNAGTPDTDLTQAENSSLTGIPVHRSESSVSIKGIIDPYIQLKNALAGDNSAGAAAQGKVLGTALSGFDKTALPADRKKTFEDIQADAMEHAEHIAQNSGNIEHQREHFEMLSNDIYDLAKIFSSGQVLYREFCPMYNQGKGAFWLSESKEIHNPYFGKEMPTCGTIKEILN